MTGKSLSLPLRESDEIEFDEYGPLPVSDVPIVDQPRQIEEAWWARIFAERGMVDPARFSPDEAYWQAVLTKESAGITGGE